MWIFSYLKNTCGIFCIAMAIEKKCLTIGVLILNSHCKVFILKDPVPDRLCSRVVYKFVCAGCNAYYIGNALLLVPKNLSFRYTTLGLETVSPFTFIFVVRTERKLEDVGYFLSIYNSFPE